MNDYTKGVVESLSWVLMEIRKHKEDPECFKSMERKLKSGLRILSYNLGNSFETKMDELAEKLKKEQHITL